MSYNWTTASTPQGRERLKELVDSLNGPEFIIVALSYKQGERFLQNIFKERAFADKSDIDRFFDDPIPIKEFLDPSPTQPKDENGLLPCPFCGESKYVECGNMYGNPLYKFVVTCKHCGATSCDSETKDEAMAAWNSRVGKEPQP